MDEEDIKKKASENLEKIFKSIQIPQSQLDFVRHATEYVRQAVTSPQFIESIRVFEEQHKRVNEAFQQMSSRINIDFDKAQAPMLDISNALKTFNTNGITDAVKRFSESQKLYSNDLIFSPSDFVGPEIKTEFVLAEKVEDEGISEVLPFLIRSFISQKDIENDLKKLRSSDRVKVRKIISEVLNEKTEDNSEQLDIQDLKEKLNRFHSFVTQKPQHLDNKELSPSSDNKKEQIRSIMFVEKRIIVKSVPKLSYSFYINGDTKNLKLLRHDSRKLFLLIKMVKDTENVPFNKELMDYLNSNTLCTLYCSGKYALTRIVERRGDFLKVYSGISARIIGESGYKKILNMQRGA